MTTYQKLLCAAQRGGADAQFALAEWLRTDDPPMYDKARTWYCRAAEQGHAEAQNNLGSMYQRGLGGERDLVEAVLWYRTAALQGEPVAQYNLAGRYRLGEGVPLDLHEAVKWLTLAADQDYLDAMADLGVAYRFGNGVAKDIVRAAHYLIEAARLNDIPALGNLFDMAEELIGFAKMDDAKAMYCVADMYLNGIAVPKNVPLAWAWFTLAEERLPEGLHKTEAEELSWMLTGWLEQDDCLPSAYELLASLRSALPAHQQADRQDQPDIAKS